MESKVQKILAAAPHCAVIVGARDEEPTQFARNLMKQFVAVGWPATGVEADFSKADNTSGVLVAVKQQPLNKCATAIIDALKAGGIKARVEVSSNVPDGAAEIFVGYRQSE
jgi:hypothetical protein